MPITDDQAKYPACELAKRYPPVSVGKLANVVVCAQLDLNPHQVDAALIDRIEDKPSQKTVFSDLFGSGWTMN